MLYKYINMASKGCGVCANIVLDGSRRHRIYTPVKLRSFFSPLSPVISVNKTPHGDPSGGGRLILPVELCCFSAVVLLLQSVLGRRDADLMGLRVVATMKRWLEFPVFFFFLISFVFYIKAANWRRQDEYQNPF